MAALRDLLESMRTTDVELMAFDRSGKVRRRLDAPAFLGALGRERERLRAAGVEAGPGGRRLLGLLFKSEETLEFVVATFAALAEGFTVVPLYPNWSAEQQRHHLEMYSIRTLMVGEGFRARAEDWRDIVENLIPREIRDAEAAGTPATALGGDLFPRDLPPDHPCAWIFTSGTSTDVARCTEITLSNIEAAIDNIRTLDFLWPGMTVHSPLSASHIFAFVVILGFLAVRPRRVLFSDVQYLARLDEDRTGRVDAMILVPIVLNRMRRGFYQKLTSDLSGPGVPRELERLARVPRRVRGWLKRLVRRAEESVMETEQGRWRGWLGLPAVIVARLLFGRMFRRRLGSPKFIVVGGAKPDVHSMALLEVMGIRCLQGWGMTETTGPLAVCNLRDRWRGAFGTCGDLFRGTKARVDGGELVVEGPQVARGYVEPGGTLVAFGGSKRTGDRAEFDRRGRLRVLGKVSDRITTDNGLNYNPLPMEDAIRAADLNQSNVLEEVVVIGDGQPRLGCVFFLPEGTAPHDDVQAYVEALLREFNARRPVDERIGPWTVSKESVVAAGVLGPSGKLVRRRVEERFTDIFSKVLT